MYLRFSQENYRLNKLYGFMNIIGRSYKMLKWHTNEAKHTETQNNVKLIK